MTWYKDNNVTYTVCGDKKTPQTASDNTGVLYSMEKKISVVNLTGETVDYSRVFTLVHNPNSTII